MIETCFYLNKGGVNISPPMFRELDTLDIMTSIEQLNKFIKEERRELDKNKANMKK